MSCSTSARLRRRTRTSRCRAWPPSRCHRSSGSATTTRRRRSAHRRCPPPTSPPSRPTSTRARTDVGTASADDTVASLLFDQYLEMLAKQLVADLQQTGAESLSSAFTSTNPNVVVNVGGFVSRFLMGGTRLPDPASMATLSPLYVLTNQQFPLDPAVLSASLSARGPNDAELGHVGRNADRNPHRRPGLERSPDGVRRHHLRHACDLAGGRAVPAQRQLRVDRRQQRRQLGVSLRRRHPPGDRELDRRPQQRPRHRPLARPLGDRRLTAAATRRGATDDRVHRQRRAATPVDDQDDPAARWHVGSDARRDLLVDRHRRGPSRVPANVARRYERVDPTGRPDGQLGAGDLRVDEGARRPRAHQPVDLDGPVGRWPRRVDRRRRRRCRRRTGRLLRQLRQARRRWRRSRPVPPSGVGVQRGAHRRLLPSGGRPRRHRVRRR